MERRLEKVEEAVVAMQEMLDGLQEAVQTLAQENQAIRLQLKVRDHGRNVMGCLERQ